LNRLDRSAEKATIVLVHGSFSGGWIWRHVARHLRTAGHVVYTPTLSGLGDRAHLASAVITLNTHIADVASLLYLEDLHDVVLVGHSYGGMVIAGVAATIPERLAALIYLDAYVPRGGESWFDLQTADDATAARLEMAATGVRQPIPARILGIEDPELAQWVDERMTPQPRGTYEDPCPEAPVNDRALRRAYIRCTQGALVPRFDGAARRAEANGWAMRELHCGHNAMLILPGELSTILRELAGEMP
jgi:pimeloyl-ACP methyl ester carboxylesterase